MAMRRRKRKIKGKEGGGGRDGGGHDGKITLGPFCHLSPFLQLLLQGSFHQEEVVIGVQPRALGCIGTLSI